MTEYGNNGTSGHGGENPLPLFYQRPLLLQAKDHADLTLDKGADYHFAEQANAVPLNGAEFAIAQRTYPIVFSDDDSGLPLALLGFEKDRNSFVDDAGQWEQNVYIPAYVRRYPFIFFADDNQENFALCVEEARVSKNGDGQPFFEDGEPSQMTQNALQFCSEFQALHHDTALMCQALKTEGLLKSQQAEIKLDDNKNLTIGSFSVVDEKRLKELSKETVLQWWEKGWLAFIHAHLMSLTNMSILSNRMIEKGDRA